MSTSKVQFKKIVSALPATLSADTIYLVSRGSYFDFYVTTSDGANAKKISSSSSLSVRNSTGTTIPALSVVKMEVSIDNVIDITLAISNNTDDLNTIYAVTKENIANNQFGEAILDGFIESVDTSAFMTNDILYLSDITDGQLTISPPTHPNFHLIVGRVIKVDAAVGVVCIKIRRDMKLFDLQDVEFISPLPGQALVISQTGTAVTNQSLSDVAISGSYADLTNKPTIPSAQIQSDWNTSNTSDLSFIKNKPAIPSPQVNSDWSASTGIAAILNKPSFSTVAFTGAYADLLGLPSIPAAQVQADWNITNVNSMAFIKNKPTIPTQLQSDWNQATTSALDFIKNKPVIPAAQIQSDWNQSVTTSLDFIKNKPDLSVYVLSSSKGAANGVVPLNSSGKIDQTYLSFTALNYKGAWNATTNVPALANGVGTNGDFYIVQTAGTVNLGSGAIAFSLGDAVIYDTATTQWKRIGKSDAVVSVNGYSGVIVLSTTDIAEGTNLYFTQARAAASVLTGIVFNNKTQVAAADSILVAIGKLQAQLNLKIGKEWHVDSSIGDDTYGGSLQFPYKTITKALTSAGNSDKIVVHIGSYTENITISQNNLDLCGAWSTNSERSIISGSVTYTSTSGTSRVSNIRVTSLDITTPAKLIADNIAVDTSITKSSTGSVEFHQCNLAVTGTINITGSGRVDFIDGKTTNLVINNNNAVVYSYNPIAMTNVTLTLGTFRNTGGVLVSAVNNGFALVSAATTNLILQGCAVVGPNGVDTGLDIGGNYTLSNVVYKRSLTTIQPTAVLLNKTSWSEKIGLATPDTITNATMMLVRDVDGVVSQQAIPTVTSSGINFYYQTNSNTFPSSGLTKGDRLYVTVDGTASSAILEIWTYVNPTWINDFTASVTNNLTVSNSDTSNTTYYYYGGTTQTGAWQINRWALATNVRSIANVGNNSTVTTLATAWASKASLSYT